MPFRLEIDESDYFLNWIEMAATVRLHHVHLLFELAPIGKNTSYRMSSSRNSDFFVCKAWYTNLIKTIQGSLSST